MEVRDDAVDVHGAALRPRALPEPLVAERTLALGDHEQANLLERRGRVVEPLPDPLQLRAGIKRWRHQPSPFAGFWFGTMPGGSADRSDQPRTAPPLAVRSDRCWTPLLLAGAALLRGPVRR